MTGEELGPLDVSGRLERLRSRLGSAGPEGRPVAALLVTNPVNIRWLTGFTGSAGLLLVTGERAVLTTDGRYRTQSGEQVEAAGVGQQVEIIVGGVAAQREALVGAAQSAAVVGLEANQVTWSGHRLWAELLTGSELVPTQGVVEELRVIKDAAEVVRMERAATIADRALGEVLPLLASAGTRSHSEVTESGFAAALDYAMRRQGAEDRAFETIVASGENSAKPHARPGHRVILPGDPVVVDFGAMFDGYRSDMTRTFCVGGEPAGELAVVFEVVAEAQRRGVVSVKPGEDTKHVDDTCRQVIAEAGWAERFEHGTGHGVGLDIHEGPWVGPGSTAILQPGSVVTVEPGVYLPGTGGVRIEDTLVVTEDGSRSLTRFPKEVAV